MHVSVSFFGLFSTRKELGGRSFFEKNQFVQWILFMMKTKLLLKYFEVVTPAEMLHDTIHSKTYY